jgi:outer membrane protein assembly factor BamB
MLYRLLLVSCLAAGVFAGDGQPPRSSSIPDFTFVHCSDTHVPPGVARKTGPAGGPQYGTAEVVAQIKTLTGPIHLKPYGVTVPAPSFAIATGDLTEFGGLNGWWDQYLALWEGAPFPVYHESGNHDSTWACQRYRIRELHGGAFYSFDRSGCHFIGWDSATPQDPRPSFGEEEIRWLREDLKRVRPETPVFLFCHHPVDSNELASLYERDRLLDLLRPYNLVLLLVGHGHAAQHRVVAGVDQVMGGSTFGPAPGYSIVAVKDGVLRVAYRKGWEDAPAQPLLERPLTRRSQYPSIRILAPQEGTTLSGSTVRFRATIEHPAITAARWHADDEMARAGELRRAGRAWEAEIPTADWEPGCHYVRVTFQAEPNKAFQRTVRFYLPDRERRVVWRAFMGGSGKGSPAVAGDLVVAGAGDGCLYAFSRKTGKTRWKFRTGGEILAQPLVTGGSIYAGSGDGSFYAVDMAGKPRWSYKAGHPVYSPAVAADGKIVFAANNGHIYALSPEDGALLWENTAPGYSIESRPFVKDGVVYYGSWDGHLYALDLKDGSVKWKTPGTGSAVSLPGVARYYSPADAGPVVAGGKVWVADRMYRLTLMDAVTGSTAGNREGISSVALAQDGNAVYLRGTDGNLRKAALDGSELWAVPARTGFVPSAPAERDGIVYTASSTGRILALDARDGRQLWTYQTTPRLYVFSDPVPADGIVYITGMDGSVTALRAR